MPPDRKPRDRRKRVFRSPGVGAVMFALLPTLWVFVPTLVFVRREVSRCLFGEARLGVC